MAKMLEIKNLHAAIDGKEILKGIDLTIEDDGVGIPEDLRGNGGLGLQIMSYRAKMIGGALSVQSSLSVGTIVKCFFPIADRFIEEPSAS